MGAIVVGYVVFAGSAVALFQGSGVDPHGASGIGFRIAATLYGALFALLAGWLVARIAGRHRRRCAMFVAGLMVLGSLASLLALPGEAIWTQLLTILVYAPLVLLATSRAS